ncbi:MAG: VWA domain-containing protein, partial [Myxococcales bacterium]|nr:VWA domain-containing protein [Myxococcales bacterium]
GRGGGGTGEGTIGLRHASARGGPSAGYGAGKGEARREEARGRYDRSIQARTLTAGTVDDNADPKGYEEALAKLADARAGLGIADKLWTIPGPGPRHAAGPRALDVALVIDTTGSMGDELEYLKVEIRDIAEAIAHHFPNVDQRYALVVYRDDGDQYVTRTFDFTGDLDAFQADLADQSANGGGDYPEAMDKAMEATAKLSWRGGETARVTFLVADAPPHANDFDDTLDAVDDLRAKGVAVYPVASSGVAGEAEFMMRAAAMLTGAQYLFLTDDSGVGNPHAEPHIPCYTVEQLAPLMVRAVRSELSGKRVEAEQQFSIRTVGQGQGGVCEAPRKSAKLAR